MGAGCLGAHPKTKVLADLRERIELQMLHTGASHDGEYLLDLARMLSNDDVRIAAPLHEHSKDFAVGSAKDGKHVLVEANFALEAREILWIVAEGPPKIDVNESTRILHENIVCGRERGARQITK